MTRAMPWLLVALGGAAGSCARMGVSLALAGRASWPLATLAVNVSGCLAFGLLAGLFGPRLDENLRALLLIGLLGGYTTFSSFSAEGLALLRERPLVAAGYLGGSVALGVLAAWAGERLGAALVAPGATAG